MNRGGSAASFAAQTRFAASGADRLRFCLASPAHISNNPRLVKEANALAAAGHHVRVVTIRTRADLDAPDASVTGPLWWRHDQVPADRASAQGRLRWAWTGVAHRIATATAERFAVPDFVRDMAATRYSRALARAATLEPADVVIGHNLDGLIAAAHAAPRLGARLGFDIEDLHVEVLEDNSQNALERRLTADVERAYLPKCDFLTASSIGIADEVARRYAVPRPEVVLNVFPWADRPVPPISPRDRDSGTPSLYWYSQTIGAGRGLDDALEAVAKIPVPVQLHLRGSATDGYREYLFSRATTLGISDRVTIHPPGPPSAMISLASEHDIGLALEQPITINRDLCVTNKLFTYMTAGLAVAATDTKGQRAILESTGDIGFLYPPGDSSALAAGILRLIERPERLDAARRRAREVAETRFSWECEAGRLVDYLTAVKRGGPRTDR